MKVFVLIDIAKKMYILDFSGRVKKASTKNFQICSNHDRKKVIYSRKQGNIPIRESGRL